MSMAKIGIVVGSLREESFSKKIANNVAELFPDSCTTEMIEIGNLPLYNEEYDDNPPPEYGPFRSKVKGFDAILFVTPEYKPFHTRCLEKRHRCWLQALWSKCLGR
jgi:chromate reductase